MSQFGECFADYYIVPTLRRGNEVCAAPAARDAERP